MQRSKVAVVRVHPDSILDDIDRLHGLAEVEQALSLDAPTILRGSLASSFPFPGANTTPWQREGTERSLRARGYTHIGDLPQRDEVTWTTYRPRATMRVLGALCPDGISIPDMLHDTNVVHLPTMRCDVDTTTAGAMANALGLVKLGRPSPQPHDLLVDLLAIQKEIHAGQFVVLDGTTAGDGPGPRSLRPVIKDVMLASADPVAIDAVAASMMGFDPTSIPYLSLADEQGLGHARRENIEVVGDAAIADQRWGFSVGQVSPLGRLQKLVARTPLVTLVARGREAFHGIYQWPLHDRKVFEQWRESTPWGQLFDYYEANGSLGPPR